MSLSNRMKTLDIELLLKSKRKMTRDEVKRFRLEFLYHNPSDEWKNKTISTLLIKIEDLLDEIENFYKNEPLEELFKLQNHISLITYKGKDIIKRLKEENKILPADIDDFEDLLNSLEEENSPHQVKESIDNHYKKMN